VSPRQTDPFRGTRLRAWLGTASQAIRAPQRWGPIAELGVILAWAIWLTRLYLNFDPAIWPSGREFGFQLQSHYLWTWLRECGLCALWNGGVNGGFPAFAETYGAPLHPLVALTSLIWGPLTSGKLMVTVSFFLAGAAQWWIARSMGLGLAARLWAGLAAVVGGHLAGRLELPGILVVVSTASTSLALAAMVDLGLTGRRRSAVLLGIMGAVAIVSGQGYLQATLIGWAPLLLVFILDDRLRPRPLWREYAIGLGLALLLAGVFLIPLIRFLPEFGKDGDMLFGAAQPLEYVPLNLVIRDIDFLKTEILGKLAFPHLYNLYVGWLPIALGALGLLLARRVDGRPLAFLILGSLVSFLLASALPFRWLVEQVPSLALIRHTPLMAGLAVPGVLAVAAYGLDRTLALTFPQLSLRLRQAEGDRALSLSTAWLIAIPLVLGLRTSFLHARSWLQTFDSRRIQAVAERWSSPTLEWVQPPWGEHGWVELAMAHGLKVSPVWFPWRWEGRYAPAPRIEATRGAAPETAAFLWSAEGVDAYLHEARHYAWVQGAGEPIGCSATGGAGDITVRCPNGPGGELTVEENSWSGWRAWVDGEPTQLLEGDRLRVHAPEGEHEFRFRYLPWDVPVGLLITLTGIGLCVWLWREASVSRAPDAS
jgi:hypothetical protein